MFGSRKDEEKMAKRRLWPWKRNTAPVNSEETVEPCSEYAETDLSSSSQESKESKESSDITIAVSQPLRENQSFSDADLTLSSEQNKKECSTAHDPQSETKSGLFARMKHKFDQHLRSEDKGFEDYSALVQVDVAKAGDTTIEESPDNNSVLNADDLIAREPETRNLLSANKDDISCSQQPVEDSSRIDDQVSEPEKQVADTDVSIDDQSAIPSNQKETAVVVCEEKPISTGLLDEVLTAEIEAKEESDNAVQKSGFFSRMRSGLNKTRSALVDGVTELFIGKKEIDDDLLEELETALLVADVGVEATRDVIEKLSRQVRYKELDDSDALMKSLKSELRAILEPAEKPLMITGEKKPHVILVVGVNGVGKTTTIGKLARQLQKQNKSVMLAAGDTFRAAAVEQLQVWGERNNIPVIAQHTGADGASVVFDSFEAAKARGADVLIADTAGRLHNKDHLMEELKKVKRVLGKLDASAPHEVLLVLDAGTGQNALSQAKLFHESVGLTGMALTKLDGTAKGGVIFALAKQSKLPIRFLGVGEQIDDLRPFVAGEFVDALFDGSH